MSDWPVQLEVLLDILVAMVLGGIIGLERQLANRPAGLRTHALVAGSGAMVIGVGTALLHRYASPDIGSGLARVIQGMVTSVGFLGAGTIFRQGQSDHIEGLTTAASILFVTVVGMAAGGGEFIIAVGATFLALVTLRGLHYCERILRPPEDPKP